MEKVMSILEPINSFMWGPVMLVLLVGTGIYLTIRLGGLQFRKLGKAFKITFSRKSLKGDEKSGDITPFQALTTTLAATVGNGNIAGVATAIAMGGPGALVWMWVAALFGMATRATEALLGMKFRRKAKDGSYIGGTFYFLEDGASPIIGKKPAKILAVAFAVAGMVATFGIGNMVQANSVALSFTEMAKIPETGITTANIVVGVVLMILTGIVLLGGIKWVGKVTGKLVPFMAIFYILTVLTIIAINITDIPAAFALIFKSAFGFKSFAGGVVGYTFSQVIGKGIARGVFSNEAGMGTGSMAHAAAQNTEPSKQAMVAMLGTFIDTLMICTMTGLAITLLLVNTQQMPMENGVLISSTALTMKAFNHFLPGVGGIVVAISSILFGYSTLIGWYYYGEQCTEYLFGVKSNIPYRIIFIMAIFLGAVAKISFVWTLSDILNAFMAIPNLIGLLILSGIAAKEMKDWLNRQKAAKWEI